MMVDSRAKGARKPLDTLYREEDRGYVTPCWIWLGGCNADRRYGRTKWNGRMCPAHHAFLLREGREIPDGSVVDHLCYVTLCVNPAHLDVVSPVENVHRQRSTILTPEDVAELRAIHAMLLEAAGPTRDGPRKRVPNGQVIREELGAAFGVGANHIKHIWSGHRWR